MRTYKVLFSPAALNHLDEVFEFIADRDGLVRAENQVANIRAACETLGAVPNRGTPRNDLKQGLRTAGLTHRVNVAFILDQSAKIIVIHGIFTGGRSIEKYFKRH